jgi:spartin
MLSDPNQGSRLTVLSSSHAISATTTLLLSGVSYASNYYVNHSQPSSRTPSSSNLAESPRSTPHGIVISNPRTRTALSQAHAVSGKAVKVSGKTIEIVEGLIKKAVGAKDRPSSRPKRLHPLAQPDYKNQSPLPSEKGGSTLSTSRGPGDYSQGPPALPERLPLRKRDRIILSADLILSTIEESARAVIDAGQHEITKVVTHKLVLFLSTNISF